MGGGGGGTQTIEYAKHIQDAHREVLRGTTFAGIMEVFNTVYVDRAVDRPTTTPYSEYQHVNIDEGFFRPGETIRSHYALFEIFLIHMKDVNIHSEWQTTYAQTVRGAEIAGSVTAHSALLSQTIDTDILPKFLGGMRNINAVHNSAFMIGKALIGEQHIRLVNDFQAKIRLAAVDLSAKIWTRKLDWHRDVVHAYKELVPLYYQTRLEYDRTQLEYQVKDRLWNLSLYDDLRAMIGALNGAQAATKGGQVPSQAAKAVSGALGGASLGASVGGVYGAIGGAAIGAGLSFVQ